MQVTKINKRTSEQLRIFAITNLGVYNIKERKKITRRIDLLNIAGITISNSS